MAFVRKCPALVALAACGTCLAPLHPQDMLEIQNGTMYNMYWHLYNFYIYIRVSGFHNTFKSFKEADLFAHPTDNS